MATTIRPGSIADLKALVAFDEIAAIEEARRDQIERGLRKGEVSVVDVDGMPKAYALLHHHFYGRPFLELLYVSAECRRSGLGVALVEHLQTLVQPGALFTSTNESNAPMRALLRRLGFEASGVIHNLDPGDPELVFFKRAP